MQEFDERFRGVLEIEYAEDERRFGFTRKVGGLEVPRVVEYEDCRDRGEDEKEGQPECQLEADRP